MSLELWGGVEATLNRVRGRFFDQTLRSGHHTRAADLELFASLGIKALRQPVLWERMAPRETDSPDFAWSDERLAEMGRLGLKPILGLLHHGSGPAYTSLIDDGFAARFAAYARACAERYPQVEDWTPINEPLTTARFSCLYGLWYPHLQDEANCWRALLNQVDGIRLAMQAIRGVNPAARLIQTEDLGFCHATPELDDQAAFENARRWLTWDLLFGRVNPGHPLWQRIAGHGFADRLAAIADAPSPPDVIGINHYVTSERFIDHRISRYPRALRAGDGPGNFVNLEAVRILSEGPLGLGTLLDQCWERYGTATAITECHNGCTREEQMRWVVEVWRTAEAARGRGVDVRAVTAWALLGSFDWNNLVTREAGHYECGVFDVRGRTPRPTALANVLTALAHGTEPQAPCLATPGWWRRPERLFYEPQPRRVHVASPQILSRAADPRPILITGRTGTLGQALARACVRRGLAFVLTDRAALPLEQRPAIRAALEQHRPWAVINAAGWVRIDAAEAEPDLCMLANGIGPENLARACNDLDLPFVTFSSDQVFDGAKGSSYLEHDALNPLNVYGSSKAEAEKRVLAVGGQVLVVRTAAFFSPDDRYNFAAGVIDALKHGRGVSAASDEFVSPTYVPDLVDAVLDLLIDQETGLWHLANSGRVSWAEFAGWIADRAGMGGARIDKVPGAALGVRATRPCDVALSSARANLLPPLGTAIDRFVDAARAA
jgi:dTDP-4-dehydrorhamnose reductase